ncbi:MAG TPA: FG-GAP-like repeat-containing protein [Ferruginibacter sp.]|nr:FG-GAP-like repeat-containing protein [Ferruginibacter sp.]
MSKKCFFFLAILFSASALLAQKPIINSFAPALGPVGTVVTITGSNFSTVPANNMVFFGAVRASVSSATTTSLTVIVPIGATYRPMTITVNGLTGYSITPFLVTFPGGRDIVSNCFEPKFDSTTATAPDYLSAMDFDGDGKPDIAVSHKVIGNLTPGSISILRNISANNRRISLAPGISYTTGSTTSCVTAGDLDGDGKPELVSCSISDNTVSVFKNTSVPGTISFAARQDIDIVTSTTYVHIADIDGDGKPDIIFGRSSLGTISILRNTSSGGNISFAGIADIGSSTGADIVETADFDRDGLTDIVVTNQFSGTTLSVFKNASTTGNVVLNSPVSINVGSLPSRIRIMDINMDGKPDMTVTSSSAARVYFFQNASSGTSLSFNLPIIKSISSGSISPKDLTASDFNGDGKPDVAVETSAMDIFQNMPGSFTSISNPVFIYANAPSAVCSADLDGDGKDDIVTANYTSASISLIRNRNNEPFISSFNPTIAVPGAVISITGLNFTGTTAVNIGGQAATFTVVNSTTITATVPAGANAGSIIVTSTYGSGKLDGFEIGLPPVIQSFSPAAAGLNQTVGIKGRYFSQATSVSFGGVAAISFAVISPDSIRAVVGNGASGRIKVVTPSGTDSIAGFTFLPLPKITEFFPWSCGPGMTVTIVGNNLSATTAVSFGGIAARSFTVIAPDTIKAIVDTGLSGSVGVTTTFGSTTYPGFTFVPAPTITSFTPQGGDPNTLITITGTNFNNVLSVTVNGWPQAYNVISSTQIQMFVSSFSPSGSIIVTTTGGAASMPGFIFDPQPKVYSISPAEAGPGTTVEITGLNFSGVTAVSLGGTPVTSFVVNSSSSISAVVGNGATGVVNVINGFGAADVQANFTFSQRPLIYSFYPASAPAGSLVKINGGNFSTTAADNIVQFGTVKAAVISSTTTSINAIVPPYATYGPLSVTVNGLSVKAHNPFYVTYAGDDSFTTASFRKRISFSIASKPKQIKIADMDGDGKPDVAVARDSVIDLYRNITANGTIAFAAPVNLLFGYKVSNFETGDCDGDGKADLVVGVTNNTPSSNRGDGYVLKNTSTPAAINFAMTDSFYCNGAPGKIIIRDFTNDGKPDIVVGMYSWVSLFRNTGTAGTFSFQDRSEYSVVAGNNNSFDFIGNITSADFNGDGWEDIAGGTYTSYISILTNSMGNSFIKSMIAEPFSTIGYPWSGAAAIDANRDGNTDILSTRYLLRNLGGNNNLELEGSYELGFGLVEELSGDGKADVVKLNDSLGIAVYKNASLPGDITFKAPVNYITGINPQVLEASIVSGDFNGDNKADIAFCNYGDSAFYILLNQSGVSRVCINGSTSFTSSVTGAAYQWQVNTGTGFSNISNNANYTGTNTKVLQLTNIPGSFRGYQYRCVADGSNGDVYTVSFTNSWTGSVDNHWENPANWSCGTVPGNNTDVYIGGGKVELNSDTQIRSLQILPQVDFVVTPGYTLTVIH